MEITPVVSFNANTPGEDEGWQDKERWQEGKSKDERAKDKMGSSKRATE